MILLSRAIILLSVIVGLAMVFHGIMCLNGNCMLKDKLGFNIRLHGISLWISSISFIIIGISIAAQGLSGLFYKTFVSKQQYDFIKAVCTVMLMIGVLPLLILMVVSVIGSII
jgi:uncharacterized membrane protein